MGKIIRNAALWLVFSLAIGTGSFSASVTIPTVDLPATGVPFAFQTQQDWLPTDSLAIQATGISCTLAGCEVQLNAAGIIAVDQFGDREGQADDIVYPYAGGAHQGALILSTQPFLDGNRPWIQLIRPTADNGLGATVVPSTVSSVRTLADYGGFLASPIAAGTTLYLATADFNHLDNSGTYHVSTVPEPTFGAVVVLGLAVSMTRVATWRKRRIS
jgi:H+/Cl- antiporter ClcA